MAEIEFDQQQATQPGAQPGSLQGYVNIAGAVTSLALIIGVGIWGYKLVRRDAAGVPVIMALKGPMRVAPDDPGGQVARNIGLAVNAVAADKPLPPPPSQVTLAPSPEPLSENDQAPDTVTQMGAGGVGAPSLATETPSAGAADGGAGSGSAVASAPAAQAAPQPAPTDPVEAALAAAQAAAAAAMGQSAPAAQGGADQGGKASVRPVLRPAAYNVPAAPAAPPKTVSIDPATLKAGTRLVQLGAYPSVDAAKAAWDRIAIQFGQLMGDHGQVIQQAESGGRVFYRLRAAGFDAESDARAFCAALQAQNAGCIPVTIR